VTTTAPSNTKTSNVKFEALMPGTKWCGSGSSADQWAEIGSYSGADLCCRQHDHCPFKVNGLATSFGYFNYRLFTVSHCDCDER
jgi:secretory phospholipase A2